MSEKSWQVTEKAPEQKTPRIETGITPEERREAVMRLRPIDDVLLRCIIRDYPNVGRELGHALPRCANININTVQAQKDVSNVMGGKSITLDVYAETDTGAQFDIEAEKSWRGAIPERPLTYYSILASLALKSGDDYSALPDIKVIFLTEHDVRKKGRLYIPYRFSDMDDVLIEGAMIAYVYALGTAEPGQEALKSLMLDFLQSEPDKVRDKLLRTAMIHFKREERGIEKVCQIVEELNEKAAAYATNKRNIEIARKLAAKGMSIAEISEVTSLTEEQVREAIGQKGA